MSENLQKRRKYASQELQNSDMDLLSNLPDSIICQIISKLKTKEAVKTSVLSTRYKSLWMYITSLSFDCSDFRGDALRLPRFVKRVLTFLESKSINDFYLTVRTSWQFYDIPAWFTDAIYRNVKVLKLIIIGRTEVLCMPACLYTSRTLEVLEICNRARGNLSLDVPAFVSLPKLTTLDLNYVNYSSDESVRRLISGCSSLEKLIIERDKLDGVTTFTIDSPTLKTLHYYFLSQNGSIGQDFEFVLNAPQLREFDLHDERSRVFSVFNLCSLEVALIHVTSYGDNIHSHYEKVVQLLQGLHNVSHLWISGDKLEDLSHRASQDPHFSNDELWMDPTYCKLNSLQDMLVLSTKSSDFYLSKDFSDTTHVVRWSTLLELPICLLSCLKTISVSGFKGRESELSMIAYILKNAVVLKKITISEAASEAAANFELREKILKFDQGSERCEIIFS